MASGYPAAGQTAEDPLNIFLLVSAYNGLTQAVHQSLQKLGHNCSVEFAADANRVRNALNAFKPDVVICPFLKEVIPLKIIQKYKCLIVHPGIVGDRGPSSIDWALIQDVRTWGIVVVEGHEDFDAGAVWESRNFIVPAGMTKSRVYGELVTKYAIDAVECAIRNFCALRKGKFQPEEIKFDAPWVKGKLMPLMKQTDCAINWGSDSAADIVRKISARDGQPGVLDIIGNRGVYLYGAHLETTLKGKPKEILATRNGAVCFGANGGALWITHMRLSKLAKHAERACVPHAEKFYKLSSATVLTKQLGMNLDAQEVSVGIVPAPGETFQDIVYQKRGEVGVVLSQFYNGAMCVPICQRLTACLKHAKAQKDTKVIVVAGGGVLTNGAGYFSNGIHLNEIDFADDPAQYGWETSMRSMTVASKSVKHVNIWLLPASVAMLAQVG